jgi:hypothetical protein
MKPKYVAFLLVISIALAMTAMLASCVSVPIPPAGNDIGKLGKLELKIVFTPNVSGAIDYLWSKQQPKPTSSK